jgi:hypothetical protein
MRHGSCRTQQLRTPQMDMRNFAPSAIAVKNLA